MTSDNYGSQKYSWPQTSAGQTARLFCQLGPVSAEKNINLVKEGIATRECLLQEDFDRGSIVSRWANPDYANCVKVTQNA